MTASGAERAAGVRIGVFGGTFDPIHVGHLVAASHARRILGLDQVLMVVANAPWQKELERRVTPAAERLELVRAAVRGVEGLQASAVEIDRGGPSYTADTLAELAAERPGAELFLVVGADLAGELAGWERCDDIPELATLAVVSRPGGGARPPAGWPWVPVDIPLIDVSSRDLRHRVAEGLPLDFLVPAPVVQQIRQLGLYAVGR